MTARVAATIAAIGLAVAGALGTSAERGSIDLGHPTLVLVPGAGESAASIELDGLGEAMMARLVRRPLDEEGWRSAFRITTSAAAVLPDAPAIAGRYGVVEGAVRFEPTLPISDDVDLDVTVDLVALQRLAGVSAVRPAERLHATLSPPRKPTAGTTRITAVYPTSGVLPVNLLKFYVYFSAPMRAGRAASHVRLLDAATGQAVPQAFLEVREELWDADHRRLTVLLDPGRIKRGVRPNLEMGIPLSAGGRYILEVLPAWTDAAGARLAEGFRKPFRVRDIDRRSPRPRAWRLTAPAAGSTNALVVRFDEPVDHAIADRALTVVDADGAIVFGHAGLSASESVWRFVPDRPWSARPYRLEIDSRLEDLAGNSLARTFDVDLLKPSDRQAPEGTTFERLFSPTSLPPHQ